MNIILYTTPSCGYCSAAKNFFRSKGINFSEYDVSKDSKKAEEMLRKSGQSGVPVIDINGQIILGFSVPEIERALHR